MGNHDPTRTLIRQVLGAVAQFEKTALVSKLKAARQRVKRETGRCDGRKPYGTRPGEADVVTLMQRLLALRQYRPLRPPTRNSADLTLRSGVDPSDVPVGPSVNDVQHA